MNDGDGVGLQLMPAIEDEELTVSSRTGVTALGACRRVEAGPGGSD